MLMTLEKQIEALDRDAILRALGDMPVTPYDHQYVAYEACAEAIRRYPGPVIVDAAVSAGKTIMISMLARRIRDMGFPAMILSRQGEIIDQDFEELRNFGVNSSIYCASLGRKSAHFPIVVGSEGTVIGGIRPGQALAHYAPLFLLIDECHHVNIEDLIRSEERVVPEYLRDEKTGEIILDGFDEPTIIGEHKGETYEEMIEAGRSSYTIIIRTFQKRAREVYGKELRIIGYTGTPYRGVESIIQPDLEQPGFWRKKVCEISTEYLVSVGAVVPTHFGISNLHYDLDQWRSTGEDGVKEFTDAEMDAMQKAILKDKKLTHEIMAEVYAIAQHRNGVLVTCAGVRHCKQAAEALPPGTPYAIITDDTTGKKRMDILRRANTGEIKFIFQVNALTTGVNVPFWDTSVILRKIGSLTLLTQLLGRGMRILKPFHIAAGVTKEDHLVLDYAGTLDELGSLYFSPLLEAYQHSADESKGELELDCPKCRKAGHPTLNGKHARRCRYVDPDTGERCEHFFQFITCDDWKDASGRKVVQKGCGAQNDIVARICRCCGNSLVDPNKNLSRTTYSRDDYATVRGFRIELARGTGGIAFRYELEKDGDQFVAWQVFWPGSDSPAAKKEWVHNGILKHVLDGKMRNTIKKCRTPQQVLEFAPYFMAPLKVSHRKIGKGKDVITNKIFMNEDF